MGVKRNLIVGALIILMVAWLVVSSGVNVVSEQGEYLTLVVQANTPIALIIGWWLTLSTLVIILLFAWLAVKGNERFKTWNERFTVRATIPGYFFIALLPAGMGIVLMILTGQASWGCWLSCLTLPATGLFLWIALRMKSN